MNRRERRAAEAASRKEPERRLPVMPPAPVVVHAFHARRVAAAQALAGPASNGGQAEAAALRVAREAQAFANALIESQAGTAPPACARGCCYCCYVDVAASAPEAFLVADRLRGSLDGDAMRAMRAKLVETDEAMRGAPAAQALRVPCAFLGADGACSVYEVRPLACRGWTSADVSACERGFAAGDDKSRIPLDPGRMTAASAVSFAVWTGLADVALDGRPVRLVAAVRAALDDPGRPERWARGEPWPDPIVHHPTVRAWQRNAYPPLAESMRLVGLVR